MGHLGHLKEEYQALVRRLEGGAVAFPEPKDPEARRAWRELLELFYTPEEADLACRMPSVPLRLERLAPIVGIAPGELKPRLDAMCDKGLVMDLVHPKSGEVRYFLCPPVVGFVEYSMMRAHDMYPKKRMAELIEAYAHHDPTFAQEVFGGDTKVGRALVRENLLDDEMLPSVLDWQRATEIISGARAIGVSLCYCRHSAEHLGRDCDTPKQNCLSLNAGAEFAIRHDFARPIEASEALELLHQAQELRLVQIADNIQQRPMYICNCCGCCCGQLRAINDFDLPAVRPSGFVPEIDDERCRGCARCSRTCPITAISMDARPVKAKRRNELRPRIDKERCIGCGVCASVCRHRASRMVARGEPPYVPLNALERLTRMALERGHLGRMVFEHGVHRGSRFFNQLLYVLTRLAPPERLLVNEQLRSRFIRYVLTTVKDRTGS